MIVPDADHADGHIDRVGVVVAVNVDGPLAIAVVSLDPLRTCGRHPSRVKDRVHRNKRIKGVIYPVASSE